MEPKRFRLRQDCNQSLLHPKGCSLRATLHPLSTSHFHAIVLLSLQIVLRQSSCSQAVSFTARWSRCRLLPLDEFPPQMLAHPLCHTLLLSERKTQRACLSLAKGCTCLQEAARDVYEDSTAVFQTSQAYLAYERKIGARLI